MQLQANPELQALTPDTFPSHTLLGLPEQLPALYAQALLKPLPGPINRSLDARLLNYPGIIPQEGQEILNRQIGDDSITANKLFYRLTCFSHFDLIIPASPAAGQAPLHPNIYADGSVENPSTDFPIGGFGLWQPDRVLQEVAEDELAFVQAIKLGPIPDAAGCALAGASLEPYTSSARKQICAVLSCLARLSPIHIASDSAATVSIANEILQRGNDRRSRPLSLRPDGALWSAFAEAINRRGRQSCLISWVKGHATTRQLEEGYVQPYAAIANGYADDAAGQGLDTVGYKGIRQLAFYFGQKQKAYAQLFTAICRRVARVAIYCQSQREETAAALLKDNGKCTLPIPEVPVHAPFDEAWEVSLKGHPPLHGPRHEQTFQIYLRVFWTRMRFAPLTDPTVGAGITWLELFDWYTHMGGRVHPAQQASDFIVKPKFYKLLNLFISKSRQLQKHAADQYACLFRAAPCRRRPLLAYGIETFMPMLSCRLALSLEAATALHSCICDIHGRAFIRGRPTRLALGKLRKLAFVP